MRFRDHSPVACTWQQQEQKAERWAPSRALDPPYNPCCRVGPGEWRLPSHPPTAQSTWGTFPANGKALGSPWQRSGPMLPHSGLHTPSHGELTPSAGCISKTYSWNGNDLSESSPGTHSPHPHSGPLSCLLPPHPQTSKGGSQGLPDPAESWGLARGTATMRL